MARPGRKRNAVTLRETNGRPQRPSRPETEKEVKSVVMQARQRVFGVSKHIADAMPETSWLGRLAAFGQANGGISRRQYEAALEYQKVCERLRRLHPVKGYPTPGDLNKSGGHDNSDPFSEESVAAYRKAQDQFNACDMALRGSHSTDVRVASVVKHVVLDGAELHTEVDTLRIGLNALAKVLKIPVDRTQDDREMERAMA